MIEAVVKLSFVERALNTLRKPDLRPAWKLAKVPLREDIRDHRKRQEGPGGTWPARAAATKERAGRNGRARRLLGRLPTALTIQSTRAMVAARSRVAWSDVHRTGGTVGRGSSLPVRDFLWASKDALELIALIVQARLEQLFGRGG